MGTDLATTFAAIRPLFARHADKGVVLQDEPGRYFLGTNEVRAKDGYRTAFGGVEIKQSYVSAHLMPVYVYPDLLDGVDPVLLKRMQGKSCFNFKQPDSALLERLEALIEAGVKRFQRDGRLVA
ncbi:MAG TPA: hypothetical protein VFO51_05210 [Sphingomicrobium sp.]|nr:hypothetical protein [Sphingomicrobium sp.]